MAVWRIQPQNMISQTNIIIIQKFVRQSNVNLIHDICIHYTFYTYSLTNTHIHEWKHWIMPILIVSAYKTITINGKNTFEWINSCLTFKPIVYILVSFGENTLAFQWCDSESFKNLWFCQFKFLFAPFARCFTSVGFFVPYKPERTNVAQDEEVREIERAWIVVVDWERNRE